VAENLTSAAPSGPPGRRQEHKTRTQRALQQAALELFAKHGFDTTTTEEIAEQAGVSPRTFFRYFPTKESVLFVGEYGWFQSLTKQFLEQPDALGDVDALQETLLTFAPKLAAGRRSFVLYDRAVASSPTLRGRVQERLQEDITTVAGAIAERRGLPGADESCALLAAVVLVTYRRALTRWLEGPANGNLRKVIADEFELLHEQLAPATSNGHRAR
jgi:AcrR family transcriptional regulator